MNEVKKMYFCKTVLLTTPRSYKAKNNKQQTKKNERISCYWK